MQRVSVVGNSGSGKSTLARRVAGELGVPYVELDAIHHLPGWAPIDPDEFRRTVGEIAAGQGWVIDGNYRSVVVDGPVWEHADTVVWVDPARPVVMRRVIGRQIVGFGSACAIGTRGVVIAPADRRVWFWWRDRDRGCRDRAGRRQGLVLVARSGPRVS